MKTQSAHLGDILVRYELGETWFDGTLQVSPLTADTASVTCIHGTDAVIALRDFLNSLDFSGRRLKLVKQA
ncbi:MAG: hypothetical protein ACREXV_17185 [Polaromonas sp.]